MNNPKIQQNHRPKKLPIGIQTFSKIRDKEFNYAYVDKTDIAYNLIENGSYYFLSRPRRFGKSLFLDTLSDIFKGRKDLFEGLAIYDKWNWENINPVINISFGSGDFGSRDGIENRISYVIDNNIEDLEINPNSVLSAKDSYGKFSKLIRSTYKKYNQKVVILIDEYDKPILDNITNKEIATKARNILRNLYSSIKDNDEFIRFVFITGVSKFSKMNLFSGLNNIEDITIDPNYATITGYTHNDLIEVFGERLEGANLNEIKKWYNGYNYFGEPIYNPYDILLFLSKNLEFRNYWWGTGNPSFLIELLKKEKYYIPELEHVSVSEEVLDSFDIEHIDLIALLWQTGYLTFDKKEYFAGGVQYTLKIPNQEIQNSLNNLFLDYLTHLNGTKGRKQLSAYKSIIAGELNNFKDILKSIFVSIPYTDYANNLIAKYEGYYSAVIFTFLKSLGLDIISEDITNKGRIDLTIINNENIIIIEFKVDSKETAIKQIKERKYYEKYQSDNKDIFLVGINFSSQEKNIAEFVWELVK